VDADYQSSGLMSTKIPCRKWLSTHIVILTKDFNDVILSWMMINFIIFNNILYHDMAT
jgi:hypothetical protein